MKKFLIASLVMGVSLMLGAPAVMADTTSTTSSSSDIFWSKHFDPATLKNGAVLQQNPYVVFTTVDGKDMTLMDYGYVLEYVGKGTSLTGVNVTYWKSEQVEIATGDVMAIIPNMTGYPTNWYPHLLPPTNSTGYDFGGKQPVSGTWATGSGLNVTPIPNWNPFVKGSNVSGFSDVPNSDPNAQYIADLHSKDLISGVGNGLFSPTSPLTREQFAKMIVSAFHVPMTKNPIAFSDITTNWWSAPYVQTAFEAGITQGTGDNKFCPTLPLKKEEAAAMVWRWLVRNGVQPSTNASGFDASDADQWALDSVQNVMAFGLRNDGVSHVSYRSKNVMNRGDAAALIDLAMMELQGK